MSSNTLTVTPTRNVTQDIGIETSSPASIMKHVTQGGPHRSAKTKEIWEEIVKTQD